ncbi:response regulator transcription factor [Pelobium manganitolerans]|uniref:response regulator transcription factor n=1 Tax=Pelobium manganitolerans TaxID=1842495 RepID=UPI003FA37282
MNVFGSEMHLLTFIFLVLELPIFCIQLFYYLQRPQAKSRKWYLILLALLILYNICGGLFPDINIPVPVILQNILAYGTGFAMGAYFPYYFYKAFDLKELRFHALYGIWLFFVLPFLIFFVVMYAFNHDLDFAISYGIVIPFFYSIVLLTAIVRAIHKKYLTNKDDYHFWEMTAVYCAVLPWASLTVIAYFGFGQVWEALFTNGGFVIISILFIKRYLQQSKEEYALIETLGNYSVDEDIFIVSCKLYGLTNREIEIAELVRLGKSYKAVADTLFISEKTVSVHIQHIYEKTGVNSKSALIHRLLTPKQARISK